ncbi:hypothetical protein MMC18_006768 [Xylographa bjoerkii]|nr:hypothetical protein [Xylographa bjoerkii]
MEVAGLVIGAVALASLSSDCIECLEYIDVAHSFNRDYNVLLTKLDIEKQRLLIWGESYGLLDDRPVGQTHHDNTTREPTVKRVLTTIRMIFTDTDKMEERYRLRHRGSSRPPGNSLHRAPFTRYASTIHKSNAGKRSSPNKFSWAIQDRNKFSAMITDLKDLIDGLENIVPEDKTKRQQLITKDIISLFPDVGSLRLIQEACAGTHVGWSDIASLMIDVSEAGTEDGRIFEWMDRFTATKGTETDVVSVRGTTEDEWNVLQDRSSVSRLGYEPPRGARSRVPLTSSSQRKEMLSRESRYPPTDSTEPYSLRFLSPRPSPSPASRKAEDLPGRTFGPSKVEIGPPQNPIHHVHVSFDAKTEQFSARKLDVRLVYDPLLSIEEKWFNGFKFYGVVRDGFDSIAACHYETYKSERRLGLAAEQKQETPGTERIETLDQETFALQRVMRDHGELLYVEHDDEEEALTKSRSRHFHECEDCINYDTWTYLELGKVSRWWLTEALNITQKRIETANKKMVLAERAKQFTELAKRMKQQKLWWRDAEDGEDPNHPADEKQVVQEHEGKEDALVEVSGILAVKVRKSEEVSKN